MATDGTFTIVMACACGTSIELSGPSFPYLEKLATDFFEHHHCPLKKGEAKP